MRNRSAVVVSCLVLTVLLPLTTHAEVPKAPIEDSDRTKVLVLGMEHLSTLGDSFDRSLLYDVLEPLAAYKPHAIAVEQLPPSEIARLAAEAKQEPKGTSAQIVQAFCADAVALGADAQSALRLNWLQAKSVADMLLATPDLRSAGGAKADSLIMCLLAAYDLPSAMLHWTHRSDTADLKGMGLSSKSVQRISKIAKSPNEFFNIGVATAGRLAHRRVYSIDDHVDDLLGMEWGTWDVLSKELESSPVYAAFAASSYMAEARFRLRDAAAAGDLLALTKRINSGGFGRADIESQWHIFYKTYLPSGADRARVALWEARNLIIAGRIMTVCAAHPGGKILVVIGAAHKPFLDEYLEDSMDVKLVSFESLLK